MKILFLVKTTQEYGEACQPSKSGLRNSARFVVDAINKFPGVVAVMEFCRDDNDCDKYLWRERPDVCILEAIWVRPDKLRLLSGKYSGVKFLTRVHSRTPFLAHEGNALAWLREYEKVSVVSFNHEQTSDDYNAVGLRNVYLPNIYPKVEWQGCGELPDKYLYKIGCFGAIRPFKNQLSQAVASILFAERRGSVVHFYVNSSRIEQRGENILKNMRALFADTRHKLVEVDWLEHQAFLKLVGTMDACMQVSFTETFNIVTADCIQMHIPVVVSECIDWLRCMKADPNSEGEIANVLDWVIRNRAHVVEDNIQDLASYHHHSVSKWFKYLLR
jgi:hypothetical protein